jgi:cytochrome c biogenesis protein CcmG/thiol:disulfide interchange protein DsbE
MDKLARLVRLVAALACSALVACGGATGKNDSAAANGPARVGRVAPSWEEPAVPSGTLSLQSLRGKVVYLNFFATWCPPCNEEAPEIERLQRQYGGAGLQVVGVDVLENGRKAEEFRRSHALTYPTVVDDGRLRDQYAVNGLPVHVFIDRQGIVRRIAVGELSAAEMGENVRRLLHS